MALTFGYIVIKSVVVPSWIILAAIMVGGIVLLYMGMRQPHIVTYTLVAYLPFSKELAGDFGGAALGLNLTNLLMIFIFVVWMTGKYSEDEPLWLSTSLNLPIILFTLLGCISVIRGTYYGTGYIWPAIIQFKRWITPVLMYFLVLNTVKDRTKVKNIAIIMMIVCTVVGLMAIYDYINIGETSLEKSRIGGISDQPNMLAAFFNYYIFLPFGFFLLHMNRAQYWLLLVPFLIQFRGIMVTFSRGGYIAFAFGLYAIIFMRSKILFFILLVLTYLTILNPVLIPAGIRYRLSQTFVKAVSYTEMVSDPINAERSVDGSTSSRIEVWKGAIRMIKEKPFFGFGYGLF
ncbi:MAG: O-antigen ligase family protein, partial [Candidatus Omnitrophica bacterium]|nr:O-antigen ligase family protein [Candidatus Omnitrophota bacterium]